MAEPPDNHAPAEIRVGPASIPYAVIGVGVALVAAIVLMGGLGIAGSLMNEGPKTDCRLQGSEQMGWVELDIGRMSKLGGTHTLSRPSAVLRQKGKPATKVCSLPRGTVITVQETTRGRDGTWLAIHGDRVRLPK
jgi:hypothetical protein